MKEAIELILKIKKDLWSKMPAKDQLHLLTESLEKILAESTTGFGGEFFQADKQWPPAEELAKQFDVTIEQAQAVLEESKDSTYWVNGRYEVTKTPGKAFGGSNIWHLSIKRLDKEPIHDWRHLQRIKTEIVGAENEAIEIYPAESRLVDGANQFHLWVFADPEVRIPCGFDEGRQVCYKSKGNGKQRPKED